MSLTDILNQPGTSLSSASRRNVEMTDPWGLCARFAIAERGWRTMGQQRSEATDDWRQLRLLVRFPA